MFAFVYSTIAHVSVQDSNIAMNINNNSILGNNNIIASLSNINTGLSHTPSNTPPLSLSPPSPYFSPPPSPPLDFLCCVPTNPSNEVYKEDCLTLNYERCRNKDAVSNVGSSSTTCIDPMTQNFPAPYSSWKEEDWVKYCNVGDTGETCSDIIETKTMQAYDGTQKTVPLGSIQSSLSKLSETQVSLQNVLRVCTLGTSCSLRDVSKIDNTTLSSMERKYVQKPSSLFVSNCDTHDSATTDPHIKCASLVTINKPICFINDKTINTCKMATVGSQSNRITGNILHFLNASFYEIVEDLTPAGLSYAKSELFQLNHTLQFRMASINGTMNSGSVCTESDNNRRLAVINTDTRERITVGSSTSRPWSYAVRIVYRPVPTGNGRFQIGQCSGTWISKGVVITARHCIYDGEWMDVWGVLPSNKVEGFDFVGTGATDAQRLNSMKANGLLEWRHMRRRTGIGVHNDVGFIHTDNPGNSYGWMSYGYESSCPNYRLHTFGYPGDKGFDEMWYSYGSVSHCIFGIVWHYVDTEGGQSGSNLYRLSSGSRVMRQVHSGWTWVPFTTINLGAKIDSGTFCSGCNFMNTYNHHSTCSC